MKKNLTIATIALAAMASCTNQPVGYTINGTVADSTLNGKTIYLIDINTEEQPSDSAVITNNAYTFTSQEALATPCIKRVFIGRAGQNVIIDNGAVVNIKTGEYPTDNGGLNDKHAALMNSVSEKSKQLRETYGALMQAGVSADSIRTVLTAEQDKIMALYTTAIEENKDNIFGALVFAMTAGDYNSIEELDSAAANVKYADVFKQVTEQRESLKALEATKEGAMFTDFAGKNIDGTVAKLSDYVGKGKYVLVDFWASWCGPCRGEIPNLVELQKKFGGKNFTVLGVNVWDQEAEFKKALESEGINYPQLYASDNQDATTIYGIKGIPQIMLFGPDGTIVKRNLRGEAMKKFVAEQLAK
ncbi:MAG: AhpC/TSA family protein [Bacteroidaceae bacterium]|nr:AhpC/TSA family protein [Bacteroidaceae bacterium]